MTVKFCTLPQKPVDPKLVKAHSILERACDSAEAFFNAFVTVRKTRGAHGTPTDHEQDLLRAALVFAAAGLDSMVKQLVRDALPTVLSNDTGAHAQFAGYVQSRLKRGDPIDLRFLAEAIASDRPSQYMREQLVSELTGSSLQSKDQLLRVATYFAIKANEIAGDLNKLKDTFDTRNQIAHEMDIQLGQPNRGRRQRTIRKMRQSTSVIFATAVEFYLAVEKRLQEPTEEHACAT